MSDRAERSLWPAIIIPAQHQQLLATFARKTTAGRRVPRRYVLSGMLRCGTCGGKLFSSVRGETRRYVCTARPNQRGCGRLTIVAAPVEEWITEAVLLRLDSPEMADALAGRTAADDRSAGLNAELQSDQAQMIELSEFYAAKGISILEWKAAREPIEACINNTNRQLAQISGSSTLTGLVGNGTALRESWAGLNLSRQAAIIAAILDFATTTPAKTRGRSFDPFRIMATWSR